MNLSYILTSKLKEIAQNKRMAVIIVICLVLGYSFILIFSSKLYEIEQRRKLAQLKNIDNTWVSSYFHDFRIFNSPQVRAGIVHQVDYKGADIFFTFKDETYMALAVEAGKDLLYHYQFEGFSDEIFDRSENRIMIDTNIANEFRLSVGDEIVVDDKAWKVHAIFKSEYFRRKIIFPEHAEVVENGDFHQQVSIVQFNQAFLDARPDIFGLLNGVKFDSLQQRQDHNLRTLHGFALFFIFFALVFIVLSILNCYLVFSANINYKRKMYGIKKTYGASTSICFGDILLENILYSLLSFHIACLLVHLFRYNVPTFSYTEMNLTVYGLGLIALFIVTVLYSLLIFRKINKQSTIKLLKE